MIRNAINLKVHQSLIVALGGAMIVVSSPASGQSRFEPAANTEAAVRALIIEPGKWEMRRSDVRAGQPYSTCMTAGDWETAKDRALGLTLIPAGCSVKQVAVRGNFVTTTFACGAITKIEELEFGGSVFRHRTLEAPKGSSKTELVVEGSGSHRGACVP